MGSIAVTEDNRRTVLITGCSPGGIGNSLAREFHRHGLRVFATARDRERIQDLAALGMTTLSLVVDDEESVRACFAEVEKQIGHRGLDYLVNNAGANYTVPAMDVKLDEARQTFETNFFGVIRICQIFLPLLIKAQGTIVQIGSVAGLMPYVFGSVYNASKAALHAWSDTLRVELAPFGVKVTTVITGGVLSRIARVKRVLAPDSMYRPIEAEYIRRVSHSQENAMPNEVYARSVVAQILKDAEPRPWWWPWRTGYKKWIWEGHQAWKIKLVLGGWLWWGFFDRIMTSMFNLWKLRKRS